MSVFVLKMIAITAMLFDHAGYIFFHRFTWMNYIGRLAFPIFAFLITEGYSHTHNFKKYCFRLCIFAFISQIPYFMYTKTIGIEPNLNILFTLLLGILTIYLYEIIKQKWIGILCTIFYCILAYFLHFDYGWFGTITIFIFHVFKNKKAWMYLSFFILAFCHYFYQYLHTSKTEFLWIILFVTCALIPIHFYNGKKGKNYKYFFYIFYPLHFLALLMISLIL